jgi:hypothetical protein
LQLDPFGGINREAVEIRVTFTYRSKRPIDSLPDKIPVVVRMAFDESEERGEFLVVSLLVMNN